MKLKNYLPGYAFFFLVALIFQILVPPRLIAKPSTIHLLQQAKKQLQIKQWEEAVKTFQTILSEDPKNGYAYANLGVALSRTHKHKKALLAYEKALQLGYNSGTFHYNRGLSFAKLNLLAEAEKEYKTALDFNSRLILAEYNLALIYNQQGRTLDALKQVKKIYPRNYKLALKLHQTIPGLYKPTTLNNGGNLLGQAKLRGNQPPARFFHLIHSPNIEYCNRMSDGKGHRIVHDFIRWKNLGLKDTVITIQGINKGKPFSKNMYSMKIRLCHSKDYVIVIRNGHDFLIENMDPIKHEIATYQVLKPKHTKINPRLLNSSKIEQISNKSILANSSQVRTAFTHPDTREFIIKCNLHPFLQTTAWIIDNPYFAVTNEKGEFVIEDIPPGTYEVVAWHPFLDPQMKTITIQPYKTTNLDFGFQAGKEKRKLYSNDLKGYRFNSIYDSFENFYGGKRKDDEIEVLQKF